MRIPYPFLRNVLMPLADKTMGTSICKYWKLIPEMNRWSKEAIHDWQSDRFKKLVKEAYSNTVYYRKLMDKMDITPGDIKSIDDVKLFPALTKGHVRANFDGLLAKNSASIKHRISYTGGSTGDPLKFIQSHDAWSFSNAHTIVNWEKIGFKYGDPYLALGSTSIMVDKKQSLKHRIYYRIKNKHGLSGINLNDDVLRSYIDYIEKHKIHFIYGYASSIYLLAKYAKRVGYKGNIKCCFPTAELLTENYYDAIKSAFNCNVLDGYGAKDGSVTAFSLNRKLFKVGYNCFINTGQDKDEDMDSALLTDLYSCVFPLINYQIGDSVLLDESRNKYNGQVLKRILGRTSEIIELDNGAKITGPGFTILFSNVPVEYYCLEKRTGTSLVCHIIKGKEFEQEHEEYILKSVRKQVGAGIEVSIAYLSKPILAKSGKRMYFLDSTKFD